MDRPKISTAGYWASGRALTLKGRTYRARVVPITGDRYYVSFRAGGRKKRRAVSGTLKAGSRACLTARFLSLKCAVTSGEIPEGAYVFVNYQVIDQNTVVTRRLELDSPPKRPVSKFAKKCANA